MVQQRRDERFAVEGEIRFRYPEVFTGRMRDLSKGGLGAWVPVTIEVNSPVEVELFGRRLLARGHVRWVNPARERREIGIQFREGDRERIARFGNWQEPQG